MKRLVPCLLPAILLLVLPLPHLHAQRRVTPEALIFREFRDGVFTVFGDFGSGTGFLIDETGVVLTNHHVVDQATHISVKINDSIKVRAVVLLADEVWDLALLRVPPSAVEGLPVLRPAPAREELAFEGERLVAIGSPLNQERILTSGIVSRVESNAIISDVNINPGNSGGPLLNMDGEVIAVNTFLNVSRTGGPGVSGSVSIYRASALIEEGKALAAMTTPPEDYRFPVMPDGVFPLDFLEEAATASAWDLGAYGFEDSSYNIQFLTPPLIYRLSKQAEVQYSQRRAEREVAAGINPEQGYSPFDDLRRWAEYAGSFSPVVILQVTPKFGQTSGSAVRNFFGAVLTGLAGNPYYRGSYTYEFKGDLQDLSLKRGGDPVDEIQRAMSFQPLDLNVSDYAGSYEASDLALAGMFKYRSEVFAPSGGEWPEIRLELKTLGSTEPPTVVQIPQRTLERLWLDFEPYRLQQHADTATLRVRR